MSMRALVIYLGYNILVTRSTKFMQNVEERISDLVEFPLERLAARCIDVAYGLHDERFRNGLSVWQVVLCVVDCQLLDLKSECSKARLHLFYEWYIQQFMEWRGRDLAATAINGGRNQGGCPFARGMILAFIEDRDSGCHSFRKAATGDEWIFELMFSEFYERPLHVNTRVLTLPSLEAPQAIELRFLDQFYQACSEKQGPATHSSSEEPWLVRVFVTPSSIPSIMEKFLNRFSSLPVTQVLDDGTIIKIVIFLYLEAWHHDNKLDYIDVSVTSSLPEVRPMDLRSKPGFVQICKEAPHVTVTDKGLVICPSNSIVIWDGICESICRTIALRSNGYKSVSTPRFRK